MAFKRAFHGRYGSDFGFREAELEQADKRPLRRRPISRFRQVSVDHGCELPTCKEGDLGKQIPGGRRHFRAFSLHHAPIGQDGSDFYRHGGVELHGGGVGVGDLDKDMPETAAFKRGSHNKTMLILKAAEVNIDNQTITGTDGVRQMHVYIPKRTPLRVPQVGEWFEAEDVGRALILKGVINNAGIQQKPGAFNLDCKTIEIEVDGARAFIPTSPGWAF